MTTVAGTVVVPVVDSVPLDDAVVELTILVMCSVVLGAVVNNAVVSKCAVGFLVCVVVNVAVVVASGDGGFVVAFVIDDGVVALTHSFFEVSVHLIRIS